MNDAEFHVLRHALGLDRSKTAYRRHFAATPSSADHATCEGLMRQGLMTVYRDPTALYPLRTFDVTDAGVAAYHVAAVERTP
jgi:hypothetical protein